MAMTTDWGSGDQCLIPGLGRTFMPGLALVIIWHDAYLSQDWWLSMGPNKMIQSLKTHIWIRIKPKTIPRS